MKDEEFDRYCAEVMGYKREVPPRMYEAQLWVSDGGSGRWHYIPATDLNQMAEVFDKLWHGALAEELWLMPDTENNLVEGIAQNGIAQAMREFIESTAP